MYGRYSTMKLFDFEWLPFCTFSEDIAAWRTWPRFLRGRFCTKFNHHSRAETVVYVVFTRKGCFMCIYIYNIYIHIYYKRSNIIFTFYIQRSQEEALPRTTSEVAASTIGIILAKSTLSGCLHLWKHLESWRFWVWGLSQYTLYTLSRSFPEDNKHWRAKESSSLMQLQRRNQGVEKRLVEDCGVAKKCNERMNR